MRDATATIDIMQQRLCEWGAWMTRSGGGDGYPMTSVLHPSWTPPAPGQTPTLRAGGGSRDHQPRELHRLIQTLSGRLQATLIAVYVKRMPIAELVRALECQASTVRARIGEAKRQLAMLLAAAHGHDQRAGGFTSYQNPL